MTASDMRALTVGDGADTRYEGAQVAVDYDPVKDELVAVVRPMEAERVRLVLGARHHRKDDVWRMPATRTQAAGLSGVFGGRLLPTEAARAHVAKLFAPVPPSLMPVNPALFPFQEDGVLRLLATGNALLGDEQGTGKTIQAIEWMQHLPNPGHLSYLIVCTNSMKYKWRAEIEAWWPEKTGHIVVIEGTTAQRTRQIRTAAPETVFVINYESLRTHTCLMPWGGRTLTDKQKAYGPLNYINFVAVVVDEAHKIKDPGAQQTMAVKRMGYQAEFRLAMTGTPLLNDPDDVWSIMNFVEPREWGSRNQFRDRYCRVETGFHSNQPENQGLNHSTRREFDSFFLPRFLRRTKAEVLPQLPEKLPIDYRVIPMTPKQASLYKQLVKDMMAVLGDDLLTVDNPLGLLTRLRQTACAVPVLDHMGNVVALDTPSNKLTALLDILEESPGEPLVVFGESRKFIELVARTLEAKKYRVGLVTGAVGGLIRQQAIDAFQAGELDVILCTLGAGAEGITLTRSNRIVMVQQSWSHGTNAQARDRIHRIGQTRGVHTIVLLSEGTVDVAVARTDVEKELRLQELVRDPKWMKAALVGG